MVRDTDPNPYVLRVDEVKKDDEERTYDWYFPIPKDVEVKEKGRAQNTQVAIHECKV